MVTPKNIYFSIILFCFYRQGLSICRGSVLRPLPPLILNFTEKQIHYFQPFLPPNWVQSCTLVPSGWFSEIWTGNAHPHSVSPGFSWPEEVKKMPLPVYFFQSVIFSPGHCGALRGSAQTCNASPGFRKPFGRDWIAAQVLVVGNR